MIVANVFDSSEGKGETLRELDPTNNREGNKSVKEGHKAGSTKKKKDSSCGESGGGYLRDGEVSGLGDGDGGNRLHGLDGHGDAEEEASGDVVKGSEDESGAEVEVGDES